MSAGSLGSALTKLSNTFEKSYAWSLNTSRIQGNANVDSSHSSPTIPKVP